MRNNTLSAAQKEAASLRKQGKIPAEIWGPAKAIFLGDDWATGKGKALLKQIHVMLGDRADVTAGPWTSDLLSDIGLAHDRMSILTGVRNMRSGLLAFGGLRDALSFPLVVSVLCLLAALVLTSGAPRFRAGLGLAYWVGALVVLANFSLGYLVPLVADRKLPFLQSGAVAFYGVLGAAFLVVAGLRWRAFRRVVLAPDAPAAEEGAEETQPAAPATAAAAGGGMWGRVGAALLLGALVTFLTLQISAPRSPELLAEAWPLGEAQGRILQLLACYLGAATAPLLLAALLAGALTACRSVRDHAREKPADYPFAAFVFFLATGAFLLAQAVITLSFYTAGG